MTPYVKWHGKRPYLVHVRICGCRAYTAIPKEKRTKYDSKSKDCILVGYYDTENLYQLWHIEGKQLMKRRDVVFQESVLEYTEVARHKIQVGKNILWYDIILVEKPEEHDQLEVLYLLIEELKAPSWTGIPGNQLPMRDGLTGNIPSSWKSAMTGDEREQWT